MVQGRICDAIKQNESELANINLKIQPNKANNFFLFFIVFAITQNAFSRELIAQSPWGFHQIKSDIIS